MKVFFRPLLFALLLVSSVALAAAGKVSLRYQGPLGEGLKELAAQSGINLVVTGDFHQPVQLMFKDLPADQALQIIAKTNHLKLERDGDVWTLSPQPTDEEQEAAEDKDEDADEAPEQAAMPPVPVPPVPPVPAIPTPPAPPRFHLSHSDHDIAQTGSVTVPEGQTVDDAVAFGGTLTVNGTVQGDATAFGGNVHLGPHARVKGDAVAFGGSVVREEGSVVDGQQMSFGGRHVGTAIAQGISEGMENVQHPAEISHSHPLSRIAWFLMEFVLCFGMGFLFLMFVPQPMKQIEGELRRDLVRCGATGALGALAVVPLSILLTITVVGILVLPVLWIGVVLAACMGYTAIANEIGIKLPVLRGKKTQATVLALGTVLMLLVSRIPVLGPLAIVLLGLAGLGAIIRTRFGVRSRGFPERV